MFLNNANFIKKKIIHVVSEMEEHSYSVLSGEMCPNGQRIKGWEYFDAIICKFLEEQQVPGASVAISKKGSIVYQQGYGIAGAGRRVQPDSQFRIASISKPVTAAIIMQLCDQLKLPLNSRVFGKRKGILKSYRSKDKRMTSITLKHLLQHSAGWDRDKVGDAVFIRPVCVMKQHPDTQAYNSALLSYALKKRLEFMPGTWHSYSNLGYLILGEVIEKLSGQPYHCVLKEFLQGLDIHNMTVGKRTRACWSSKEVEYFNNRDPQLVESIFPGEGQILPQYGGMAMESSGAYGGLISDTSSLLKFVHCMEESLATETETGGSSYRPCQDVDGSPIVTRCWCSDVNNKYEQGLSENNVGASEFDIKEENLQEHLSHEHSCNVSYQTRNGFTKYDKEMCDKYSVKKLTRKCLTSKKSPDGAVIKPEVLCVNDKTKPLLSADQARESLVRPSYENGRDWYGLGWDVQDNGQSWGHTGGMEGSCGTLFHHHSGLNWAFLLNSWAVDSDLNGVIKCGLCTVPQVNMYSWDTLSWDCELGVKIITCDKSHIIYLGVSEDAILLIISKIKSDGYFITWISNINHNVLCVARGLCGDTVQDYLTTEPLMPGNSYVVIFKKCDVKNYFVVFNKTASELRDIIDESKKEGFVIHFLDSFCDSTSCLKFTALFRFDHSFDSCERLVHLAMKATKYVKLMKEIAKSHYVTVQSVTEVDNDLYVSAVFSTKSCRRKPHSSATHGYNGTHICQLSSVETANSRPNLNTAEKCAESHSVYSVLEDQMPYPFQESCKLSKKTMHSGLNNGDSCGQNVIKTIDKRSLKSQKARRSKSPQNSNYWVQITPESFLTVLNRQADLKNGLVYAKFYTWSGKPYVSGCWMPQKEGSCYQRIAMSKYGLVPELVEAAAANVYLQCLSEYVEEDGVVYYAAVWYGS